MLQRRPKTVAPMIQFVYTSRGGMAKRKSRSTAKERYQHGRDGHSGLDLALPNKVDGGGGNGGL